MNLKTTLFLICSLFLAGIHGQSVNLSNQQFNVNYVGLPTQPILVDANRTYHVNSYNSEVLTQSFSSFYFEREISIPGFSKLADNAFLTVESRLVDVNLISSEIKSETKVTKDDDGKETRTTTYWAVIRYDTEGLVKITSADGTISETLGFSGEKEKTSKTKRSWDEANAFRKKNRIKALRIEFVKNVIASVNHTLATSYGYRDIKTTNTFSIVKGKKHPEAPIQKEQYQLLKTAFSDMSSSSPIADLKTEISPAIAYFKSVLDKYPGEDRKSKKLKKAALYNLSTIHYYLDEPDMTIQYADQMLANDKGKGEAKRLKNKAEELKHLFEVNTIDTRHFEVITEDNTNYEVVDAPTANVEDVPISENKNYTLSYVLLIDGDTIPAYINSKRIITLSNSLPTYVKDFEGKYIERNFNADEVETIIFGNGEKFKTVAFKEATDAVSLKSTPSGRKFVKQLFSAGSIKLYRYQMDELVIKKRGEKLAHSTSSAGWVLGFKKKLAALVENECPPLAERAINKEFTNNADSLIEFMRAYKECTTDQ